MGWGDCGDDSQGRPIGYLFDATCDHPGCTAEIHRGIAYVCGRDMHGEDDVSCERYYCGAHVEVLELTTPDPHDRGRRRLVEVCAECAAQLRAQGLEFDENDEDDEDEGEGDGGA